MNGHRITYDILDTVHGRLYTGTCRCGAKRTTTTSAAVSKWGPRHVVTAYEATYGR